MGVAAWTARTYTRPATHVDRHSWRTLAEERARRVDALAIDTHAWEHLTLVHIWQIEKKANIVMEDSRLGSEIIQMRCKLTFTDISLHSGEAFPTDRI